MCFPSIGLLSALLNKAQTYAQQIQGANQKNENPVRESTDVKEPIGEAPPESTGGKEQIAEAPVGALLRAPANEPGMCTAS